MKLIILLKLYHFIFIFVCNTIGFLTSLCHWILELEYLNKTKWFSWNNGPPKSFFLFEYMFVFLFFFLKSFTGIDFYLNLKWFKWFKGFVTLAMLWQNVIIPVKIIITLLYMHVVRCVNNAQTNSLYPKVELIIRSSRKLRIYILFIKFNIYIIYYCNKTKIWFKIKI